MTTLTIDTLKRNGWQVAANNIFALPGVEVVPAGPFALQPAKPSQSVRFVDGQFQVLEQTVRPNGDFLAFDHAVIFQGDELALLAWLAANGRQSEGGQPAGYRNVWD